jgi:hypothetical protein
VQCPGPTHLAGDHVERSIHSKLILLSGSVQLSIGLIAPLTIIGANRRRGKRRQPNGAQVMKMLVSGLVATGFCFMSAPALAENTHDMKVTVVNETDTDMYASFLSETDSADPTKVDSGGGKTPMKWTIKGCPQDSSREQAFVWITADSAGNDGIGSATYYYDEEGDGCHLKFNSAKDDTEQYELVDENDSNSEHDRILKVETAN